ncbi:MAG: Peptidase [Planctomycetota bacterium]
MSRLLERFLRYVTIDTTADPASTSYPSSPGQWDLGRVLVSELREIGLQDVELDAHGLVWGTVPATVDGDVPVIAFNSHIDTSPETTGKNVKPQVIRDYQGGDIMLPGDPTKVIRVADCPELAQLTGRTIITTDGTTLLGGDDKAGVAVIVEMAARLMENRSLPHGPVKVLFTCDEEIGHGIDHVDFAKLGATAAYTLDGAGAGEIDVETFSANQAVVTVRGVNIHPSIAKGRMVNAVRAAAALVDRLPRQTLAPEVTAGRDGFLHPYHIEGGVAQTTLWILLRDFDSAALDAQAAIIRQAAVAVERDFPGVAIDVSVKPQYRNLGDGLKAEPRAVEYAEEAFRRLGLPVRRTIVRGGTDGSQMTARGLPTPNLSTGQHTPHSPLEWACLDEMEQAVQVITQLVQVWAGK